MKIGILGSGMIGGTLVRLLVETGHEVMIANTRGPATLTDLTSSLGPKAHAGTVEEAAAFGDAVVVAIPLKAYRSLSPEILAGKIVIDAMNYYPDRDGHIPELDSNATTSSELLAAHLPQSKVVKAFNTIYFKQLATQGKPGSSEADRRAIFVAGDDAQAKAAVAQLIREIGFAPVDTGDLHSGGASQQPNTTIYNRDLTAAQAHAFLARA
jgi:predicted dinucleotide-binding enzyme